MGFYGGYFSFDEKPCNEFDVMLYDFSAKGVDSSSTLVTNVEIVEDTLIRRDTPLHYGTYTKKKLEFDITFGVIDDIAVTNLDLDRYDMERIARWLTGHQDYRILEIQQPDMELFRYKCIIDSLKYTMIGNKTWAFTASVICDSAYAYKYPSSETISKSSSTTNLTIYNPSSTTYYQPYMTITPTSGGTFAFTNKSDNDRVFQFTNLPTSVSVVTVDNQNQVIQCPDLSDVYSYSNFNFFRLVRGYNEISITGTGRGTIQLDYEFPVRIGG